MIGSGGNVEPGREDVVSDALKYHVGMQIGDVETPELVHCQNRLDLTEEACFVPVEYGSNGAELNFARNGMKKRVALDVENVHAKCHITVVLQDKTWDLHGVKSSDMLGRAFCCFSFKGGYVGTVDE
jgi:hypothetical protein